MWHISGFSGLTGFASALVVGTLVEYVVHRAMHRGKMLGKKHAEHHQEGAGQGVCGEFADYFIGGIPVIAVGFCIGYFACNSLAAGLGFVAGSTAYAMLAAYSHQLQHERPELAFWMVRPVHHLHHHHRMWKHNFGITVDIWDRVFGTYKPTDWRPERRARNYPLKAFFRIKWL